jgi:hypothetical protein
MPKRAAFLLITPCALPRRRGRGEASLLHITTLLRTFATLIEKDGGIRPCDVLATCAYKVLNSTYPLSG